MILSKTKSFSYIAILFLFVGIVRAQDRVETASNQSTADVLAKVEETLLVLKSQTGPKNIDLVRRLERQLTSILQTEPNTIFRERIESNLDLVNENLAFHDLLVAQLYMGSTHFHSLRGAASRLGGITQKYPKFSKMDEVLIRLAQVALEDERKDDATIYLWRLVCNYPGSEYIGSAFQQLNQIGVKSWEGCQKYRP
jgi:hypothetical protein